MRTSLRCLLSAVAAGALTALPLSAQDPAVAPPRTHTVVRGDNLWDLSARYLGNPFLWPEIYRLNRDVVEDPHWIYPGEVLRLPGGEETIAEVPGAELPPTPGEPEPFRPAEQTVFTKIRPAPDSVPTLFVAGLADPVKTTVRAGEVIAAPFVDREGGPRGFGRILKSGDLPGIAQASDRFRFQAYDRIFIAPPVGHVAAEGERYLAYKLGPMLEGQGQIMIPTGIVEVTRSARSELAAVAKVVRAFTEVTASDRLIPLDTAGVGTTDRPVAVVDGPSTTIKWIYGEPVLPSVQSFVVLGVSSHNGVRMGDEFLVYQPATAATERQLGDPEIPISRMQVVRSTPFGVTAVILGQEQPAIKEGMNARVLARMP